MYAPDSSKEIRRSSGMRSCWGIIAAALGLACSAAFAVPRQQIEADWQLQDETRLAEIRLPGMVRFAEGQIEWPGCPQQTPAGATWQVQWREVGPLGFGKHRVVMELITAGPLDPPVEISVESTVFTARMAQRKSVLKKQFAAAAVIPLEFQIDAEGASALTVTARRAGAVWSDAKTWFVPPVAETLQRAAKLSAEAHREAPPALAALREAERALAEKEKAAGPDAAARAALYRQARWLAREAALKNPSLAFKELLFVKRFTQETYPDVCLNHMPWCSRPGGDLCVLSMGEAEGADQVRTILAGQLGPGHVRGADLWWDGSRIVFGYARSKTAEPPAGWLDRATSFDLRRTVEPIHLFEIGVDGRGLRQLTRGEWSDLDPTYLPNGDIAFVSERCGYSLQCNELDKDETSCNLYVMRPDGSNIRRLSVTKDGDYLPHALDDGTIGYTRWEYQERSWANIQSIWTVHPDGTAADAIFKQHFNDPWSLEDVRSVPGTKQLAAIATGHHTLAAGPVVLVEPRKGINEPGGITIVTPGVVPPEGGMSGSCVPEGGVRGKGGHYMTPWPLSRTMFLASYTYGPQNDVRGYGLYLVDVFGTRELIYRDSGISSYMPIPLRPRPRPPILPDLTDAKLNYAICTLADAARGSGLPREKVRYLRIAEGIAWPYTNTFGGERFEPDVKSVMVNWNPVRVLGTVPIEADGSAHFQVPVDTPVYFQLLDENQMELRRMRSFISFQPGEQRGCVGCHESWEKTPNDGQYPQAMLREPSCPKPPPWGTGGVSFLRDVQPVLDKHCTGCHAGLKPAAGIDLSGGLTAGQNRAYDSILTHKLVARSNVGEDARVTPSLAFGSHRSKLVEVLRSGSCSKRATLSSDDWLRLVTWIDANGPYHDGFINKRIQPQPYDMPADGQLAQQITTLHAKRCASCHAAAQVSRLDLIDLRQPAKSLFLAAPLAKSAGGTARCPGPVYKNTDDADYKAVLALVEAATQKAWKFPRRDLRALVEAQKAKH